jgi:hypothetical protein
MSAAEETVSTPGTRNDVPRNPEDAHSPGGTLGQPEDTLGQPEDTLGQPEDTLGQPDEATPAGQSSRSPEHVPPTSEGPSRSPEGAGRFPEEPLAAEPVSGPSTGEPARAELAAGEELQRLVTRWKEIQAEFVDEPTSAVAKADELVAETMDRLSAMFARERSTLEQRWSGSGTSAGTEELRQSLRRYRALFERLLAA